MRKALLFIGVACLTACSGVDIPKANYSLFQAESVSAESGDGSVLLKWTPQEGKPLPLDYYISWAAGSPSGADGDTTIVSDRSEAVIPDLVNDCAYTFSVQSRFKEGLAMKVSASCTPKSTRIPVSGLKAMAGDGRIFLSWKAPETSLDFTYRISISADGAAVGEQALQSGETSSLIENLVNGKEYVISITCVYPHGDSPAVTAAATPGEISAISPSVGVLHVFQICAFEYNPAYFVQGEIVKAEWSFGDGGTSSEEKPSHMYKKAGIYDVSLTVTYSGGKTETASISITVADYMWSKVESVGYQKANHVVFSPDGQVLYTVSNTGKKLIAIDAINGTVLWEYSTSTASYGAGPAVGADGTIYFGTEDAEGSLYAITASGTLKWKTGLGAKVKASPAVTSDGNVYALADNGTLTALDASTGTVRWKAELEGTASGVAVDAAGNVYSATSKGIWAYTSAGTSIWKNPDGFAVTERGGSIALYDGILYAALKKGGGAAAIDMTNGSTIWQVKKTDGDCYHPVVDSEGTVYFCEKAGYLYAVKKDGTAKWSDTSDKNYIYSGFAIDSKGNAYISQYASPFGLLRFDTAGNRSELSTIGAQTMSPVTIGPDRRVYFGTNGTISAVAIDNDIAMEGWPMRGCNQQGTNSLR